MRPAVPLYWRLLRPNDGPFLQSPSRRRSEPLPRCLTPRSHSCVSDPAPHLHPSAPGPTDAAPRKGSLRPATRPTASRSCARIRSASLVNTPDLAPEALSAQTDPPSSHAPATTHASIPTDASPSHKPENHTTEQSQIIIYLQL